MVAALLLRPGTETKVVVPKPSPSPSVEQRPQARLGHPVVIGDGFGSKLVVTPLALKVVGRTKVAGVKMHNLVAIELLIQDEGAHPVLDDVRHCTQLYDSSGRGHAEADLGARGELAEIKLAPGYQERGWLLYSLPPGAIAAVLRYQPTVEVSTAYGAWSLAGAH